MSRKLELKYFERLEREGSLPVSAVPRSVQSADFFKQLESGYVIGKERAGGGQRIIVLDSAVLTQMLNRQFPGRAESAQEDAFVNARKYRDSKAGKRISAGLVLLRGTGEILVNDKRVDIGTMTKHFGCFSALQPRLAAPKICLVENLDCFLRAEDVLGSDYLFLHTYGRFGKNTLPEIKSEELFHFGDYDYTGLEEYLRLRAVHPSARLFVPDALETIWATYPKVATQAKSASKKVFASKLPEVIRVRNLLEQTGHYVEQQSLFPDQKQSV